MESIRREIEPKVRLKLSEARAEWLELKSNRTGAGLEGVQLRVRAFLLRTNGWLRMAIARQIGRLIMKLEKARNTLTRGT